MIVASEVAGNDLLEKSLGTFSDAAAEITGSRIVIDFPAGRIRGLLVDPRFSKREGICVDRVSSAMFDVHGMIWNRRVQIANAERAAILRFCVVILETENPFTGRRFCGALAKRHLNGGDGTEVTIHHAQMRETGCGRVRVGVDEARQHGLSAEIHLSNAGRREIQDVGIFPNGKESAPCDCNSFCNRLGGIHRHDVAVMQNEFRFFLFQGKEREGSKRAEEFSARRFV